MNFSHLSNLRQTQVEKQSGKQVTWSENLLDIKTISPRYSKDKFKFPSTPSRTNDDNCRHFICGVGQPCRLKSRSSTPNLHKATKKNSIIPLSQYQSNTRPTTIYFKSSPQLQEVIYRAVNSDHQKSTYKHESQFQYEKERTYDWKQNINNFSLNFHESEKYIDVRKI